MTLTHTANTQYIEETATDTHNEACEWTSLAYPGIDSWLRFPGLRWAG